MRPERYEFDQDGLSRYAYFHLPSRPQPVEGWPLVLALHGGGSTPLGMMHFSQILRASDDYGFAVVLPAGTGPSEEFLTWNAGRCCGHAARRQVDDVAFLRHVVEDACDRGAIDSTRVYATGISNGGMMAYRLAAELPHLFAAIAPVAGALVCDPPALVRAIPVIHFHGTQDEFVPYDGGRGARSLRRVDFPSVADSLSRWRMACGLTPLDSTETLFRGQQPSPDRWVPQSDQRIMVTRHVHAQHEERDAIVEITIDGGGHTWPGVAPPLPFMGPTVMSVSANELIWRFFEQFRLPS